LKPSIRRGATAEPSVLGGGWLNEGVGQAFEAALLVASLPQDAVALPLIFSRGAHRQP